MIVHDVAAFGGDVADHIGSRGRPPFPRGNPVASPRRRAVPQGAALFLWPRVCRCHALSAIGSSNDGGRYRKTAVKNGAASTGRTFLKPALTWVNGAPTKSIRFSDLFTTLFREPSLRRLTRIDSVIQQRRVSDSLVKVSRHRKPDRPTIQSASEIKSSAAEKSVAAVEISIQKIVVGDASQTYGRDMGARPRSVD